VNVTGDGGAYTSIQDAIDNASDGDTVFVYSGLYYENVIVNKTISLVGEDRNTTEINAWYNGDNVLITSDYVNITGFNLTRTGSDPEDAGIELNGVQNCKVFGNIAVHGGISGILLYLSNNNTVVDNNASQKVSTIRLKYSNDNIIQRNVGYKSNHYGIFLDTSFGNNIFENNMSNGDDHGIAVYRSSTNNITDNYVYSNKDCGIFLRDSYENNIINNNVSKNYYGIRLDDSNRNYINGNIPHSNNYYGIRMDYSDFNNIINNDAIYNRFGIDIYQSHLNNITGNTAGSNSDWGINLRESNANNISNNNASYGDLGIVLSASSNNNIAFNNASQNNLDGIQIGGSINNNFRNNTMENNGMHIRGINVEHWNMQDIDTSNTVNGKPVYYLKDQNGGSVPQGAGQVILANCTNVNVENQELDNGSIGVELGFSSNNTIANNNASSNNWFGFYLWRSTGNTLTGNYVSHSGYRFMTDGYGIFLDSSSWNKIIHNNASSNNMGKGIYLWNSTNNTISRNILSNNNYGIYLSSLNNNNNITYNTAFNNSQGIRIYYSKYNNVASNNVSGNGEGIYIGQLGENYIIGNNVSNNTYGIRVWYSGNNTIYHNNIINNTVQAYNDISDNYWDNGYPLGGNYWSDYGGIDYFKGPSQNMPGSDGVGDTPYTVISTGTEDQDNYPLMEPYSYKPLENYAILKQGWNLISIPFIQLEQNLTKVLEMIDGYYDAVQWYSPNDLWKHHKVSKPYGNDLRELNETMGFWIHITNPGDTIFLYNGTQPIDNQTITLHPGWNLVGYPSQTSYNRTEGLNNLTFDTHVNAIWTYDAGSQTWKELGESDYFIIGKGYWMHSKVEITWKVPI
jgi:parallel beta-helix repeat protein